MVMTELQNLKFDSTLADLPLQDIQKMGILMSLSMSMPASLPVMEAAQLWLNQEKPSITMPIVVKFADDSNKQLSPVVLLKAQQHIIDSTKAVLRQQKDALSEQRRLLIQAARLIQIQKHIAETAVQNQSGFIANLSREVRTPLNAITGMTTIMLETNLSAVQRDFIETIRNNSETLLVMINNYVDLSFIENRQVRLERNPFDIRECIESTVDILATKAAEKGIGLSYLVEPHTPATITGDQPRLRQIILNMLNNAVKYTDKGEVILWVSARPSPTHDQPVDEEEGEEYVFHFAVKDTGSGIAKDKLEKLLTTGTQSSSLSPGGGLGLVISRNLIEMMGGSLWAESRVNRGSIFHFTIRAPATNVRFNISGPQSQLMAKRILVIDSNRINRQILSMQTESWGMTPITATSLREALQMISRGEEFSAILVDLQLEGSDVMAFAKDIHASPKNYFMPIVGLIPIDWQASDPRLREFAALITKPVKPLNLFDTLLHVLASGTSRLPETAIPAEESQTTLDTRLAQSLPLRILVAEDNSTNQRLISLLLGRLGYRADMAANGYEVLEALRQKPYDVVLMDVLMPEMDGLEATRVLRTQDIGSSLRIIAMTASTMQGDREKCLEAGMDGYISKPIDIKELVNTLKKCRVSASSLAYSQAHPESLAPDIFSTTPIKPVTVAPVSAPVPAPVPMPAPVPAPTPARTPPPISPTSTGLTGLLSEAHPLRPVPVPPVLQPIPVTSAPEPPPVIEEAEEEELPELIPNRQVVPALLIVPEMDDSILDYGTLERLRETIGEDANTTLFYLIGQFLNEAPGQLSTIRVASEKNDLISIQRSAHTLKSTSASFGVMALSHTSQDMEIAARAGDFAGAIRLIPQLEQDFTNAKLALKDALINLMKS